MRLYVSSEWNLPASELCLPKSLTEVFTPFAFNQPVHNLTLPSNLTRLTFGFRFNKPLTGLQMPNDLTHLAFSPWGHFNRSFNTVQFPHSLTQLDLPDGFTKPLQAWNPPVSLTRLNLGGKWTGKVEQLRLPDGLKSLRLPMRFDLARTIRHSVSANGAPSNWQWPTSLTELEFCASDLKDETTSFVEHAEQTSDSDSNTSTTKKLDDPQQRSIESSSESDESIECLPYGWLPPTLVKLTLPVQWSRTNALINPVTGVSNLALPSSLHVLHFHYKIAGAGDVTLAPLQLPVGLLELHFYPHPHPTGDLNAFYDARMNELALPTGLQTLVIDSSHRKTYWSTVSVMRRPEDLPKLPASLRHLRLDSRAQMQADGWDRAPHMDEMPHCSVTFLENVDDNFHDQYALTHKRESKYVTRSILLQ